MTGGGPGWDMAAALHSIERSLQRAQGGLALTREINRFSQNAGGFLGRVEPHRVFRLDKVEVELCFALEITRRGELLIGLASAMGRLEIRDKVHEGGHGEVVQLEGALLDGFGTRLQLSLRPSVTGLTGMVDVEQGTAHVVIADLGSSYAHVGHVAIRTCDPRARMNALVPQLELGVLGFEDRRTSLGMHPVLELRFTVTTVATRTKRRNRDHLMEGADEGVAVS
jgi:hypothetical protein